MARRFIDLSIYLETDVISDPPGMQPEITYIDHEVGVKGMVASFPGLTAEELPDAEGWAVETIKLRRTMAHTSTRPTTLHPQ